MANLTETQVAALIANLTATLPGLLLVYKTVTANQQGIKTLQELVADADAQYDANIAQLDGEQ